LAALRVLGDAPARSLTALAQRLGVSEADVAAIVTPLTEDAAPIATAPAAGPVSPLLPMTARNGGSSALKSLRHRWTVIVGRKLDFGLFRLHNTGLAALCARGAYSTDSCHPVHGKVADHFDLLQTAIN
jgi:hypothetical protein